MKGKGNSKECTVRWCIGLSSKTTRESVARQRAQLGKIFSYSGAFESQKLKDRSRYPTIRVLRRVTNSKINFLSKGQST